MRLLAGILLGILCGAVSLVSASAMTFDRSTWSWPSVQVPLRLPHSRDGLGSRELRGNFSLLQPGAVQPSRVGAAEAGMRRDTPAPRVASSPALASVTFLGLGLALPSIEPLARPQSRQCRISPARAERIERTTSDPCLAADSAPGGVCFEKLGQDQLADASVLLNLRGAHC